MTTSKSPFPAHDLSGRPLVPLRRSGMPSEIGSTVAMLANPTAVYITGQTIHVNGEVLMP